MVRAIVRGVTVGAIALLLADAVAARLGLVSGALPSMGGSAPWTLSRALGVTAYLSLSLDVVFGLLVSTRAADRIVPRARSIELHRFLSSATLVLVLGHAGLLLVDGWVRFDALDVLVPFVAPHRPFFTGLGVLAFWSALVLHASFELRKRIGPHTWRRLHGLSFVVFVLATLHGLFAGSDGQARWLQVLHLGALTFVSALVVWRLRSIRRAKEASS